MYVHYVVDVCVGSDCLSKHDVVMYPTLIALYQCNPDCVCVHYHCLTYVYALPYLLSLSLLSLALSSLSSPAYLHVPSFSSLSLLYPGLFNDVEWHCDKLKKLDLSHNRLRALPDTFHDLRRMVALNVAYNYLKEIPQSCSWGCVNLVSLRADAIR